MRYTKGFFFVTGIILVGIVSMQVYWLVSTYQNERLKFKAEMENALSDAMQRVQLQKLLGGRSETVLKALEVFKPYDENNIKNISESEKKKKDFRDKISQKAIVVDSSLLAELFQKLDTTKSDSTMISEGNIMISSSATEKDTFTRKDLEDFSTAFAGELKLRKIDIPFQLAIRDDKGSFVVCTTDSATFLNMPLLSYFDNTPGATNLQAAFPYTSFAMKKMLWLLLITAFLIIIGTISFSFLVIGFVKQKKIQEIRNDFVNNMTHELKTPIASVSIALEMIERRSDTTDKTKMFQYMTAARKEIDRLENMVEQVLMVARLEDSRLEMMPTNVKVKPWLEDIITRLRPFLEYNQALVSIRVDPDDLQISVDEMHFTNVIQNIVENAVKYSDKEIPKINIVSETTPGFAYFYITDNGLGIAKSDIQKIFDKFYRVSTGDQHKVKGYGLGLSYVRDIVRLHQGEITVDSTPGKGSTFKIKFPTKK